MKRNITRVCALDTMYTLLQYLLLSSEKEIESTFYFWLDNVDKEVRCYFADRSATLKPHKNVFDLLKLYYFVVPLKWRFLLNKDIQRFGSDHIGFECAIFRKYPFELLEDGLLCYVEDYPYVWKSKRFQRLKTFLFFLLFSPHKRVGEEKTCVKIHLTGLKKADILNDPRVIIQSFPQLWANSSEVKRNNILDIFGIERKMLEELKEKKWILLTQPFSEDKLISESSKIAMYKKIVDSISDKRNIVIKPHPREKTDYKLFFPEISVLTSKAPIQLFSLCGVRFYNVCTVCSTAAYDFPYDYNLYYYGTDVDSILYEKMPNGRRSKLGQLSSNINIIKEIAV